MGKGSRGGGDDTMKGLTPTKSYAGVGREKNPKTNAPSEYRQSPVLTPQLPQMSLDRGVGESHPMMPQQPVMGQQLPGPGVPPPAQGVAVPGGQTPNPPGPQSIEELLAMIARTSGGLFGR